MAAHGISYRRINIRGSLANPFSWAPPLFRAIDPMSVLRRASWTMSATTKRVWLCRAHDQLALLAAIRRLLKDARIADASWQCCPAGDGFPPLATGSSGVAS
jgi:hypothetical protein